MLFYLLLYCASLLTIRCFGAQLYKFGIEHGDQELSFSNDSYGVALDVPMIYFEENQNELFISSQGIVTFGKAIDVTKITDLDQEKINAIALFFAPATAGKIFYRATSNDLDLLNDLTDKIRKNFPNRESPDFTALHAVVITWNDMVGENPEEGSNQFQTVLVTDGMSSYAFLIYHRIEWTGKDDQQAQAGLYFSDGRRETMVNSGTTSIKELVNLSNNQNEGSYIFRISGASPEDPRGTLSEDDYSYIDYEHEYDPDGEENRRQHKPSLGECPPDPYREQCPAECQVLTDDHGCSLCVCTQPPESHDGEAESSSEVGSVIIPSQREQIDMKQKAKEASQEQQSTVREQPEVKHEHYEEPKISVSISPENSGTIHDVEDIVLSCAAASEKMQPCSSHARCIDYHPGYCCECLSGYYGNGEECLRDGEPQRINGGFEGVINGEEMQRTELHTYVMVEEGRSYTALSQIPPQIGRSLLLLNSIGDAMGWLFAKVMSSTSYNGFMLTGGLFNRTVNVRIDDRYSVTIKQQFSGRDIYHYFKAQMFITGTMPTLPEGVEVIYPDQEVEFRREGPGFLRSHSSQTVTVKENDVENQMKLSIDQQINYKECSFREFTKDSVVVIQMSRLHVVYDAEEHIVRYASANIATNQRTSSENACENGRHLCTLPNMICTPVEPSYRCECLKGYQAERDSSVELGWRCVDMNECERGDHTCDHNAICINLDGTFECRCGEEYEGDGHYCRKIGGNEKPDERRPVGASGCFEHRDCHQWGECVFGRNGEPGYCKCRGWYVGDGVNHCGPPGETEIKQVVIEDSRPGNMGQTCGGYQCDANAYCDISSGYERCMCRSGYHGNGISCVIHVGDHHETNVHKSDAGVVDSGSGKVCRSHEECGKHSSCVYSNEIGGYRCVCVPPYISDGVNCVESKRVDRPTDARTCREASDCHQNAHCVVRENSLDYSCECLPGYHGDGVTQCTAADECNPGDSNACNKNAECVFSQDERAYTCKCMPGFVGDGRLCIARQAATCDEQPGICHPNAQCVYSQDEERYKCICKHGTVGDGYTDCRLEDELHRCGKCSSHARCVHVEADNSWRCRCLPGYMGNGHMCKAYSSCLDDRSLCDEHAECVPNEYGHYVCNCHYGYHGNGQTCTPDSESREETLFVCRGMTIIQKSTNPDLPGKQLVVVPHQIAVGIDFDCQDERIIWSDIAGHSILSASINGTDEQRFMNSVLKSPEGIAVDWSSRNVYYTDSVKDEIGVASLDGKYHKTLIKEGLVNPRALAIDLNDRYLYYSDWHRENPVIGRVRLDGTENTAFVTTEIHLPNGLAVLLERRELCWVDAGLQRLSCIGMNGQNRRIVYMPLQYPFGLTIHNEERFYWTDWSDNKIHSVSVNGEGYMSFPATIGGSGRLYGLIAVPLRCRGTATACAVNNGGCEHLCLPGKMDVTCACPDNIDRC